LELSGEAVTQALRSGLREMKAERDVRQKLSLAMGCRDDSTGAKPEASQKLACPV
jgi:hypothetical protein